jgi:hypothetical protein
MPRCIGKSTLYLAPQHIGFVVLRSLDRPGCDVNLSILIATVVAIILAGLPRDTVEKSAMKAFRGRYKSWRQARVARSQIAAG